MLLGLLMIKHILSQKGGVTPLFLFGPVAFSFIAALHSLPNATVTKQVQRESLLINQTKTLSVTIQTKSLPVMNTL
jgi:hypothetical protein